MPRGDLGDEAVAAFDAAVEALAFEDADFDLNHVEPAGVLGGVVELETPEHASRLGRRQGGVESGGSMGRQVVEHDSDVFRLGEIDIDEFAHAPGEIAGGAMVGDFDPAPRAVSVEEDEEVDGAVAAILVVEALGLSRCGRDRLTGLADELDRAFVEADDRSPRIRRFGVGAPPGVDKIEGKPIST